MPTNRPFSVPQQNYWQGNQFVIPGYTPGFAPPPVVPPSAPPPTFPVFPGFTSPYIPAMTQAMGMPMPPPILPPRMLAPRVAPVGILDTSLVPR